MFEIFLPDTEWQSVGDEEDPTCRLLAHIRICGCDMHLEAFAVTHSGNDPRYQHFDCDGSYAEMESNFYSIVEDAAQTCMIGGREYVLIATPFQR